MENFIAYNEALIDERDQGIAEIGKQIADVHEMFQVRPQSQTLAGRTAPGCG